VRNPAKILLLIGCGAVAARAATTTEYDIVFAGQPSGRQVTTIAADGSLTTRLSYRNNGRGPDLDERIAFAADGGFASYRVKGTSTFGSKIDESYRRRGGRVSWRSSADRGERTVQGAVQYLPVEGSFAADAAIARVLLAAGGRGVAALPAGELTIERLAARTVTHGGEQRAVALYAIRGASTEPDFIWLTDDAERSFFAAIEPGYMIVAPRGWVADVAPLEAAQKAAGKAMLEALAARLAHRLGDEFVVRGARVFDSEHATLSGPQDVYIHDGRIAALYPAGSRASAPMPSIDGSGRVLLPGLFDMHTHESAWNVLLDLAGGRDHRARHGQRQPHARRACAGHRGGPACRAADRRRRFHRGRQPARGARRLRGKGPRRGEGRGRLVRAARLPAGEAVQLDAPRMDGAGRAVRARAGAARQRPRARLCARRGRRARGL